MKKTIALCAGVILVCLLIFAFATTVSATGLTYAESLPIINGNLATEQGKLGIDTASPTNNGKWNYNSHDMYQGLYGLSGVPTLYINSGQSVTLTVNSSEEVTCYLGAQLSCYTSTRAVDVSINGTKVARLYSSSMSQRVVSDPVTLQKGENQITLTGVGAVVRLDHIAFIPGTSKSDALADYTAASVSVQSLENAFGQTGILLSEANVSFSAADSNGLTVNWIPNKSAKNKNVTYKLVLDGGAEVVLGNEARSHTFTDASYGMHTLSLTAVCGTESITISKAVFLTDRNSVTTVLDFGTCGENVTWALDVEGTLFLNGSGAMQNYAANKTPWYDLRFSVKKAIVAEGITTIGDNALAGCINLESATLPDSLKSIGDHAFSTCLALSSITIPDNVETIDQSAFADCEALTSIRLPDSVKTIGMQAFRDCKELTNITLGNGLIAIGVQAFSYCKNLESISIPDGVETIAYQTFASCDALTNIQFGSGVTAIEDEAFVRCLKLESIVIPSGVLSIGASAFGYNHSLKSATIPASVREIGEGVFRDCRSLTDITVNANNLKYCSQDGVLFNKQKTVLVQYPGGKSGAYTVPDGVNTIAPHSFYYCQKLTDVSFPADVTYISDNAFTTCTTLKSVTFSEGLKTIGSSAFSSCHALENVNLPKSLTEINPSAFRGCSALTSITVPGGVTTVGNYAFGYCDKLTRVILETGVKTVDSYAFSDCQKLADITVPGTVQTIGNNAFSRCDNLQTIYYSGLVSDWNNISAENALIPETVKMVFLPVFSFDITTANGQLLVTADPCDLPADTVFLGLTVNANGKALELKPVTATTATAFDATDVNEIKVFAWGNHFTPVSQNCIQSVN